MPLVAGTVSINGAGVASGAGMARELYDALESAYGIAPASVPANVPGAQEQLAVMANVIASVVVNHIVANGLITVAAGIPVATAGSASAQSGATTGPGTGTIA